MNLKYHPSLLAAAIAGCFAPAEAHGITAAEMDATGLSDEERAALADDDNGGEGDEAAAAAASAGGEDDDDAASGGGDDDAAGGGGDDDAAAAAAAGTGDEAAAASEEGAGAEIEDDDLLVARSMRIPVQHVDDYDTKMAALAEKDAELAARFKDGEDGLELDAFLAQQREIQREREELASQENAARNAEQFNQAADTHDWTQTVDAFFRHSAKGGLDYRKATIKVGDGKDAPLLDEFDRMVKLLGNDPANVERSAVWFLKEADAIVRARYGLGAATSPQAKPGTDGKPPARAKANLSKVPKTLGDVPAANDTETRGEGEGEFAHLAGLDALGARGCGRSHDTAAAGPLGDAVALKRRSLVMTARVGDSISIDNGRVVITFREKKGQRVGVHFSTEDGVPIDPVKQRAIEADANVIG